MNMITNPIQTHPQSLFNHLNRPWTDLSWPPMTSNDIRWTPMTSNDRQWPPMTSKQWLNDWLLSAHKIQLIGRVPVPMIYQGHQEFPPESVIRKPNQIAFSHCCMIVIRFHFLLQSSEFCWPFDYILTALWLNSDFILTTIWLHSDYILTRFWLQSGYNLTTF